jgi:hypothetical protein
MLDSLNAASRKRFARSSIANDPLSLPGVGGRSLDGRRFREIAESRFSDLNSRYFSTYSLDGNASDRRSNLLAFFSVADVYRRLSVSTSARETRISVALVALWIAFDPRLNTSILRSDGARHFIDSDISMLER